MADRNTSEPDTLGRPTSTGTRQQTQTHQGVQSGSKALDRKSTGKSPEREAARRYQDRPADEGKHGDAADEPTERPIGSPVEPKGPAISQR